MHATLSRTMNSTALQANCQDHQAITQLLVSYFDGLYHGDTKTLANTFHPKAQYACACSGEILLLDMPTYFTWVKARHISAKAKQARHDQILSIDIAGPETAMAKVNCSLGDRYFTDFLSLIKEQRRWHIIAKVFHYDLLNSTI